MSLNKFGRVYGTKPGDAAKLLPKEVIARANEQKRIVESGGKKKGK